MLRRFVKLVGRRRNLAVIGLSLLLSAVILAPIWAAETRGGDKIIIGADEVVNDDFYAAGEEVIVNGTIKGDLFAIGRLVEVNGVVEGDLMVVAQAVKITGTVKDDARVAGQIVYLDEKAVVGSDLLSAQFGLEARPGSRVEQDFFSAGSLVALDGDVGRNVKLAGTSVRLSGKIGGDAELLLSETGDAASFNTLNTQDIPGGLTVPSLTPGLTLADTAQVDGKLTYVSGTEIKVPEGAKIAGGVSRKEPVKAAKAEPSAAEMALDWVAGQVQRFLTMLLVGLLIVWAAPGPVRQFGATVQKLPLPSLGWGAVALVAFVLGLIVLAILIALLSAILGLFTLGKSWGDFIGLGLLLGGGLTSAFILVWAYLAQIIVVVLVGRLVLEKIKPDWSEGRVWPLVVGLILFVLLTAIPCLGSLLGLLASLAGLGALWLEGRSRLRPPAEAAAPAS